ncbi:MAG: hypothetical protein H6747_12090 [Deltaproteobacteria bacterium]|nr:hypothetical protein [Deltaproteobacteria bacterium]
MRRIRTTAPWATTLAVLLLAGCGSEPVGTATDATVAGGTAAFGAACKTDTDCKTGLFCQSGDFAPEPFCTMACDEEKTYCDEAETGGVQGLCIQVPDDFQGPVRRFCAPICNNTGECKALSTMWSTCDKPEWKNVRLYPELPTRICLSPETHGQIVVDPVLCDWEKHVTDPKFSSAKQVCKAYCDFLVTCKFWDKKQEALECCGWRCFQKMTPGGAVDDKVEDETKCYLNAFGAAQGTGKVCEAGYYEQSCGAIGDPHAP